MAATITLAIVTAHLTEWLAADSAVTLGQSYTIGDRTLTRAHGALITEKILFWSNLEASLTRQANSENNISYSTAKFS